MKSTIMEVEGRERAFSGGDEIGVLLYKYTKCSSSQNKHCPLNSNHDSVVVGHSSKLSSQLSGARCLRQSERLIMLC
jgi:hypothetical protein